MTDKNKKTSKQAERDSDGLIKDFEYNFDSTGFIDWRSLIPESFLFVNKKKFENSKKDAPTSLEGLDDSDIIIKLGGIKWLAKVRGYKSVTFDVIETEPSVVTRCQIEWTPNFENPEGAVYQEVASCGSKNGDDFCVNYAETISANRAFVRCVRNFLNVNIVGEEEFSANETQDKVVENEKSSSVSVDPQSIFIKICKEKDMDFEQILDFCASNSPTLKGIKEKATSEKELVALISPKIAKSLLKALKKS